MILKALPLTLAALLFASLAGAEFTMTPGVDLFLEYDDNIYLTSDNEEDDVITTIAPNISMTWETSRVDLSLYASVLMEKYLNNTDEDRFGAGESKQASRLDALAKLYREVFFLRVSDSYSRVPIDEGGRGGAGNRNINLTDSNLFQVNPYLQFELMKATTMNVGYTFQDQWYEEDDGIKATSHIYNASLTREMSDRISMSVNGAFSQYRPKDPNKTLLPSRGSDYEHDRRSVDVGLSYQATERLLLKGHYGHAWIDYDVRSDTDTSIWSANADYEITSSYKAGAAYKRDYDVTVNDGPVLAEDFTAYVSYDDKYKLKCSLFAYYNDYIETIREDEAYGGEVSGELPFDDKTGITGFFRYTNYDEDSLFPQKYDRYSTNIALYYETRLGRISGGYTFNHNDSDSRFRDYTNNIIYVNAALRF